MSRQVERTLNLDLGRLQRFWARLLNRSLISFSQRKVGRQVASLSGLTLMNLVHEVVIRDSVIRFVGLPKTWATRRFEEMEDLEPETLDWLDRSKGVLWDVGANVGTFTVYAALHGMTAVAFEPSFLLSLIHI